MRQQYLGPLLYFRGVADGRVSLAAIVVRPQGTLPPTIATEDGEPEPQLILSCAGIEVHRYSLDLPARARAAYSFDGERIELACDYGHDLRIAFASCNGQEEGDLARPADERNVMWRRLGEAHREQPFQLFLQGGDQIYADEVTLAHPASRDWPKGVPEKLDPAARAELSNALREAFVSRYLATLCPPEYQWLAARVPTLAMWDDHDITDGWGSRPERILRSDVGKAVFAAARETFLVFQMAEAPDAVPPLVSDRSGKSLTWSCDLPGLRIVAPDLRSERTMDQVMGQVGWRAFEAALKNPPERLILISTVPALGPRLSLVEWIMERTPWAEEYEDDLRDQWQSRAHREEWRSLLCHLVRTQECGTDVTVVSGEIHLATRGTMATRAGPIHQLVASGIAHPPPSRRYALSLGALAWLGEAPLEGYPIRLRALPGQRQTYVAERNFLILERRHGAWSATWELEGPGRTPPLRI